MVCRKMFLHLLAACFILSMCVAPVIAQIENIRPRQVTTTIDSTGAAKLENDPVIISLAEPNRSAASVALPAGRAVHLNQLLLAAIDMRFGAPYVYGASGPRVFDCSGFIWSVFQSAGISFERSSARSLWERFAPARQEEETKFGTLVFFNNLTHVGIVADEHGFYHASRSQGVTYSPFAGYWGERIDGFRRVPMPTPEVAE